MTPLKKMYKKQTDNVTLTTNMTSTPNSTSSERDMVRPQNVTLHDGNHKSVTNNHHFKHDHKPQLYNNFRSNSCQTAQTKQPRTHKKCPKNWTEIPSSHTHKSPQKTRKNNKKQQILINIIFNIYQ